MAGGYGLHGITVDSADSEEEDDTLHGPELFVSKELVNANTFFYLSATTGAELDISPRFSPTTHLGVDMGIYPLGLLTVFGGVRGVYILGGKPGLLSHAGLGLDGPFQAKLSFYITPLEVAAINSTGGAELFWPVMAIIEVGARFYGAGRSTE